MDNNEEENLDIVKSIFQARLGQSDLDRILQLLSDTDRGELIYKLGDLLRRVSALVDITNRVSDTLSLDVLLPRLIEVITETLVAERSSLFLNDPQNNELYSRVAQGDGIREIRFPNHLGVAGSVLKKGIGEIIPDAYGDDRFNQSIDKETGFRTRNILCTPIKYHGKIIGVSQVLNKKSGDFSQDDLILLETLTGQAAAALENAQLHEKVTRAAEEEALLLRISNALASELDLDALLSEIVKVATHLLQADRGTLFLYDDKTDTLWSKIAGGDLGIKEIRIPATAGLVGSCYSSGETINIKDAYQDTRFNQAVDKQTGYRTVSILCMPVVNKAGKKLGVIQLLNKKDSTFNAQDEKRLAAFTSQGAVALENAQLFEDVRNERNFNESILKSLSNGVITLNTELQITKINDAAIKVLGWQKDDIVKYSIRDLFDHDGNQWIIASLEKVAESGRQDNVMDVELRLGNEELISVNVSTVPLIDVTDQAIGFMLIIEDITSEKRMKSTMARYMTKEIADRLLEGGDDALGGAAQEATVLFSDIRSFTDLSEEMGARKTVSMLNLYFTHMIDVIFEHGGILDKYIGDAIMAIFGAPFPGPNDADNGLQVANKMISELNFFNLKRRAQGLNRIHIGVGLSSGGLIAGNIGSPKRMEYTVIGDSVNLAARLESATKFYGIQVLLSEFTVKELTRDFMLRELDFIQVKGKTKPVAVYEGLDHYNDGSFPNMNATLAAFSEGLSLYRDKRFTQAEACFRQGLTLNPDDAPSKLYIDRCEYFRNNPPPEDWNGVWVMTSK